MSIEVFDYWGWVSIAIPLLAAFIFLGAALFSSPEEKRSFTQKDIDSPQKDQVAGFKKSALEKGLDKSRQKFWNPLAALLRGRSGFSQETFEKIEEILYGADLSPKLTGLMIEQLKKQVGRENYELEELRIFLREMIISRMTVEKESALQSRNQWTVGSDGQMQTVMIVGVNGVGKTTSVGKLAAKFSERGGGVVIGACDTFRMAAVEQLEVWAKRANCEMVRAKEGADPSGVAYDTMQHALKTEANYCLIDTAGRLHTKDNLMNELKKVKRVLQKLDPKAPEHIWLVLDAVTGQNAIRQAEEFHRTLGLTGLILTKCDGSSKAGAAVSIVENLQIPITFIGVGEGIHDLHQFDVNQYVDAMLLG